MSLASDNELKATLHMVLTRLDSAPSTIEEWKTIRDALLASERYATKTLTLHVQSRLLLGEEQRK